VAPSYGGWIDDSLPVKKGDPERPIIPITIGPHIFKEAICDFGASVNIIPKVIYEKIHGDLCCTQSCVCNLQISHSATPIEFLKTSMCELGAHMYLHVLWL
jgi:hypothetical protein